MIQNSLSHFKKNWFWPLTLCLLAFAWSVAMLLPSSLPPDWELAFIFDAFITLPVLFFLCYRKQLSKTALAVRIVAIQCLGIWLATKIVPIGQQELLSQLVWLRYLGLAVLAVIEIKLAVALFKIVYKPATEAKDLEAMGMPPMLAKLALLEAQFWRWVFSFFKR